jgi:hypothetical protein
MALILIVLLVITISLVIDKSIYSYKTRSFSKIAFFFLCIVAGIAISEFLTNSNNFFYLDFIKGHFIPHYELAPSLLIVIGGIFILGGFYTSYSDIRDISKSLISKKSFLLIYFSSATVFIAFMANLTIQTISPDLLIDTPFLNKDLIYFLHFTSLNLISFSVAYFSYTQPFLNLTGGLRPNLLLEKGLIGYYLAYHSDNGPEPLAHSKQFALQANLSFKSLAGLAVSSIVLVGMFSEDDARYVPKVSLIPIPSLENYSAIIYTFSSRSESINDNRFREKTPTVYGILFPSNLTIAIRNMNQTLKYVLEVVSKHPNIDDLNQEDLLSTLTTTIIRKILLK